MRALASLLLVSGCAAQHPAASAPDLARPADPYADAVVSYVPGEAAGLGQDRFPEVVLGAPEGSGAENGSLHVLSLGKAGEIVLALSDIGLVDGPDATNLLVFENPFVGWAETAFVAVSSDGKSWHEWPCDGRDKAGGYPGCAGVQPVLASRDNGVDATKPKTAGGDAFNLASLGVASARFVRIRDSGENKYTGSSGGFDLDAIAVVHGAPLD